MLGMTIEAGPVSSAAVVARAGAAMLALLVLCASAGAAESAADYIWHLGLNWSVLVNVETQFEWLRSRPGFEHRSPPLPRDYLEAGPMSRVWPEGLALPDFLLQPAARRLEPSP